MREEIIYLRVNDLRPYKGNPRNNAGAVGAVAESIRKFGFRSPIVIDETNTVINGHTRLKAAKELGLEEVPCVRVTDLTLSRWMRREMSEDRRERVLRAVVDLIMERGEIREEPMLLKD